MSPGQQSWLAQSLLGHVFSAGLPISCSMGRRLSSRVLFSLPPQEASAKSDMVAIIIADSFMIFNVLNVINKNWKLRLSAERRSARRCRQPMCGCDFQHIADEECCDKAVEALRHHRRSRKRCRQHVERLRRALNRCKSDEVVAMIVVERRQHQRGAERAVVVVMVMMVVLARHAHRKYRNDFDTFVVVHVWDNGMDRHCDTCKRHKNHRQYVLPSFPGGQSHAMSHPPTLKEQPSGMYQSQRYCIS